MHAPMQCCSRSRPDCSSALHFLRFSRDHTQVYLSNSNMVSRISPLAMKKSSGTKGKGGTRANEVVASRAAAKAKAKAKAAAEPDAASGPVVTCGKTRLALPPMDPATLKSFNAAMNYHGYEKAKPDPDAAKLLDHFSTASPEEKRDILSSFKNGGKAMKWVKDFVQQDVRRDDTETGAVSDYMTRLSSVSL